MKFVLYCGFHIVGTLLERTTIITVWHWSWGWWGREGDAKRWIRDGGGGVIDVRWGWIFIIVLFFMTRLLIKIWLNIPSKKKKKKIWLNKYIVTHDIIILLSGRIIDIIDLILPVDWTSSPNFHEIVRVQFED